MKTFEATSFSLIFSNLIKKGILHCVIGYHFEFTLLWTEYRMSRAIDHKNSSRQILEKFLMVLIRLIFLFISFSILLL